MAQNKKLSKVIRYCLAAFILYGSVPGIAFAADLPADEQKGLNALSRDFAKKIGDSLGEADLFLSGAGRLELAEHKAGTILPDNEPLLLRAVLGKEGVSTEQGDIYAIKRDAHMMVSLGDFAIATGLAMKVTPSKGTATGWFFTPNQTFDLDVAKGVVNISGRPLAIDPKQIDVNTDPDHIFVSVESLEKWFGVHFDYELSKLNILIRAPEAFPVEDAYLRAQRKKRKTYDRAGAKLPPLDPEFALLSLPYIDTDMGGNATHGPGQKTTYTGSWSTIVSGDYAGLNTKAYFSGTAEEPYLNSARLSVGKEDPTGNLLGPLHATAYRLGDINTVSNSMIGGGGLERGVYITDKPLGSTTTKTATQIFGDMHPGWDVELYRNESFIDIRHVGVDGRYDFGDVDLIAGENDFKLLFYGPLGEREEEHRRIGVDKKALENNKGAYEVSFSQQNRNLWERIPSTAPEAGSLRSVASYERGFAGLGALSAGIRNSNDQGEQRTFVQAGLATYFLDTFFNADLGMNAGTGDMSTILTARRNFDKHSFLIQEEHNSKNYNSGSPTLPASVQDGVRVNLSGPLISKLFFFRDTNYSLSSSYADLYNGQVSTSIGGNITTRVQSILFNAGLQFSDQKTPGVGGEPGTVSRNGVAVYSMAGPAFGGYWRVGNSYQILPVNKFQTINADYSRTIFGDIGATTQLSYEPETQFATGSVALNFNTAIATVSPRVQYDTNRNLDVGVNVHIAAVADPYSYRYHMYPNYMTENGGVAARIFADKNGNGVFDDGDDLLQDAQITAVQGYQSASSNEKGIAFIPDLPKNRLTDIVVDSGASDSAYGISLFKGVAIRPHPGAVTKLDFPIVESGEMDGQAEYTDDTGANRPVVGAGIGLIAPDGRIEKSSQVASDGYWSISVIQPGIYYLIIETDEGYFTPQQIEFKPQSTILFGQAIKLQRGHPVLYYFTSTNLPPDGENHARVIVPSDIQSQKTELMVGKFNSRLALALAWYKLKLQNAPWVAGFDLATPVTQAVPDKTTNKMSLLLKPKKNMTIVQATAACQSMNEPKLDCAVNVITTYRDKPSPAAIRAPVIASQSVPEPANATEVSAAIATDQNLIVVRPTIKDVREPQTVFLNLGSYNSRELMTVIWFKLKTRYTMAIGDAQLLVKPTQAIASPETGKFTLRAALPVYNLDDAKSRCQALNALKQECSVEVMPAVQGLRAVKALPKG